MKKIAKLVMLSPMVRVIVDENATDEEILDKARPKLLQLIKDSAGEIIEDIIDDEECHYGTLKDDKK